MRIEKMKMKFSSYAQLELFEYIWILSEKSFFEFLSKNSSFLFFHRTQFKKTNYFSKIKRTAKNVYDISRYLLF